MKRLSVLSYTFLFALPLVFSPAAVLRAQTYVPQTDTSSDMSAPPASGSGGSYAGGTMPSRDALQMRVGDLEQQIRSLTDQVERKDFEIRQLRTDMERLSKDVQSRLSAVENGAAATAATPATPAAAATPKAGFETPAALDAPVKAPTAEQQSAATPAAPATDPKLNGAYKPDEKTVPKLGEVVETKGKASGVKPTPSSLSAAKDYDAAFSSFQAGKYADAEKAFAAFLKLYPTHALAANAQYWQGESQFATGNYQSAARTFARNFQSYPKAPKAPDALLRLSDTLDKMGKTSDACLTLKEMKTRFPTATPALQHRAEDNAKRLGCGA